MTTRLITLLILTQFSIFTTSANNSPSSKLLFDDPYKFSDFRLSFKHRVDDIDFLVNDLSDHIEKIAHQLLPENYQILIKFHDIDMAGNIVSYADYRKTHKYLDKSVLEFEYMILDADEKIISHGNEKLIESNLQKNSLSLTRYSYSEFDYELLQFSQWLNKKTKAL